MIFFSEYRLVTAGTLACLAFACSAVAFEGAPSDRLAEAQKELFADRFDNASSLYSLRGYCRTIPS